MRRVISLWLPRLATDLPRRRRKPTQRTEHHRRPLVTIGMAQGRGLVLAVDDEAAAMGLAPGMGVADARALVPEFEAIEADPASEARALGLLADWCERYTPFVAIDGSDGLLLDVTGSAHLFGGETAMLDDLVRRVQGFGLAARACLADTPGAAWAVARFADLPQGWVVLPRDGMDKALMHLPVAALRLPPGSAEEQARLGLRRIADLRALELSSGRAALTARFGEIVWRRYEQALGRLDEPISPRRPVTPYRASLAFAEPIATAEDIARTARRLLGTLTVRFATEAVGARRIALDFFRVDGVVERVSAGTSRPSRDPAHLFKLLEEKLGTVAPGFGFDLARIAAPEVESLAPVQADLHAEAPALNAASLAQLIDRLSNRLGPNNVWRLQPRQSHIPERAAQKVAALAPAAPVGSRDKWSLPARPLRLLKRPEPIDVIAADDVPSLFRWHTQLHRVRAAEGPERLAPEWWHEQPPAKPQGQPLGQPLGRPQGHLEGVTRDYWRVEDESGRRFWIFRRAQGPKPQGTSPLGTRNAWFMHGEFA